MPAPTNTELIDRLREIVHNLEVTMTNFHTGTSEQIRSLKEVTENKFSSLDRVGGWIKIFIPVISAFSLAILTAIGTALYRSGSFETKLDGVAHQLSKVQESLGELAKKQPSIDDQKLLSKIPSSLEVLSSKLENLPALQAPERFRTILLELEEFETHGSLELVLTAKTRRIDSSDKIESGIYYGEFAHSSSKIEGPIDALAKRIIVDLKGDRAEVMFQFEKRDELERFELFNLQFKRMEIEISSDRLTRRK